MFYDLWVKLVKKRERPSPKCKLWSKNGTICKSKRKQVLNQHAQRWTMVGIINFVITLLLGWLTVMVPRPMKWDTQRVNACDEVFRFVKTVRSLRNVEQSVKEHILTTIQLSTNIEQESYRGAFRARRITLKPCKITASIDIKKVGPRRLPHIHCYMIVPK